MTLKRVEPRAEILAYGPSMYIRLPNSEDRDLTPEEVIALASGMTFKDKNARDLAIDALNVTSAEAEKEGGQSFEAYIKKSLMNSALRGHASLTTSAGLWVLFNDSSKHVDSMFTGAQFASGLMPSGRRIPISLENIFAPESVLRSDRETQELYERVSRANVSLYLDLLDKGLPKEEVAKLVQYGLSGGGFMFIPLETLLQYDQEFSEQRNFVPDEGLSLIAQLKEQLMGIGMSNLYAARAAAARNTPPFPFIYSDPRKSNLIDTMVERNRSRFRYLQPFVFGHGFGSGYMLYNALDELLEVEARIKQTPEGVLTGWREALAKRRDVSSRFRDAMDYISLSKVAWRVWGEVKRHRTVPQQVQSIHQAAEKANATFALYEDLIAPGKLDEQTVIIIGEVMAIPASVKANPDYLLPWLTCAKDSFRAYKELIQRGIPAGDASSILPRGTLVNVLKRLDTYQVLDGYLPLRMCGTCEPEMRATTRAEARAIQDLLPEKYRSLVHAKCFAGFCFEPHKQYEKCGQAGVGLGFKYDKGLHDAVRARQIKAFEEF